MDSLAPPVVAVVVTCDPGPWFEETLAALSSQDYPNLSVLVLDAGSSEDPTPRVAEVLPTAYVRRLDTTIGFGPAANEALEVVEGASHFVFCHDDVAPERDAIWQMVQEAFRSNAGIVAPKLVSWDDPGSLLAVGMGADKAGAPSPRVEPGEIDQEQHDAVRDVFVAPGAAMLVRADLFETLGGFDPAIFLFGEDLDLCWRAQIAGARVIVAPAARIRHRQAAHDGERPLRAPGAGLSPRELATMAASSLDRLQIEDPLVDRHRQGVGDDWLAALAEPEGAADGGVIAQGAGKVAQAAGHIVEAAGKVAEAAGAEDEDSLAQVVKAKPAAAAAVTGADAVSEPRTRARRSTGRHRPARMSRRASSRTVTIMYLRRRHEIRSVLKNYSAAHLARVLPQVALFSLGEIVYSVATGRLRRAGAVIAAWRWNLRSPRYLLQSRAAVRAVRVLGDGEVRRLQVRGSARLGALARRQWGRTQTDAFEFVSSEAHRPWRRAAVGWVVVALALLYGSRNLLADPLPVIGQFAPLPGAANLLHQYAGGWNWTGAGGAGPAPPSFALLGLGGLVLGGSVGLLQKILVLGLLPLGVAGLFRLTRGMAVSSRLAATVVYLVIPLPYDALARGQLFALVLYGTFPWVLRRLLAAMGAWPLGSRAAGPASRPRLAYQTLGLGLLLAVVISLAPPVALSVVAAMAGLAIGAAGSGRVAALRPLAVVSLGSLAVAFVLCIPWSLDLLRPGAHLSALTGLASSPAGALGLGEVMRFQTGPLGGAPVGWVFVLAALPPLVLGRRWRVSAAAAMWSVAVLSWGLAWAGGRGWLGGSFPVAEVMLVPAAAAVAVCCGLGVEVVETDLPSYSFGWRQALAPALAALVVLGALPVLASTLGGRWNMPSQGFDQALSWLPPETSGGAYRVLWVGDPAVLPLSGWRLAPGAGYATSEGGLPVATDLWPLVDPGPSQLLAAAVTAARDHETTQAGRLLAPLAVRYVVVPTQLAPAFPEQPPLPARPLPPDLVPALQAQDDLRQVAGGAGLVVFQNMAWAPERAQLSTAAAVAAAGSDPRSGLASPLTGSAPVLPGGPRSYGYSGRVGAGTVLWAAAASPAWQLSVAGQTVPGRPAFGSLSSYRVRRAGPATLSWGVPGWQVAGVLIQILLWLVAAGLLLRAPRRGPMRERIRHPSRGGHRVAPRPAVDS